MLHVAEDSTDTPKYQKNTRLLIKVEMKSDCIKDNLELLTYIRSSKNISETKEIIDTICGIDENGSLRKQTDARLSPNTNKETDY